jgi:hypothetical protein
VAIGHEAVGSSRLKRDPQSVPWFSKKDHAQSKTYREDLSRDVASLGIGGQNERPARQPALAPPDHRRAAHHHRRR